MHSHCTNNLLNLEDVFNKKVVHADDYVKIFIETKPSIQTCPCCGNETKRIHDYRYQMIKDLPFQLKHTYLILRKRRYICRCGKRFMEKHHFLATYQLLRKYYKRSRKLILARYEKLKDENKKACDLMLLYKKKANPPKEISLYLIALLINQSIISC